MLNTIIEVEWRLSAVQFTLSQDTNFLCSHDVPLALQHSGLDLIHSGPSCITLVLPTIRTLSIDLTIGVGESELVESL